MVVMTPEQEAKARIDSRLTAVGWVIQGMADVTALHICLVELS